MKYTSIKHRIIVNENMEGKLCMCVYVLTGLQTVQ